MRGDSEGTCANCGYYLKNIVKFLISHIGLVSLVVGYTIIGAFTFERLEAEHELQVKQNMSNVRLGVTDDLWDITCRMRVLNDTTWSDEARGVLQSFEKSLIKAIKNEGWDGNEDLTTQQWTFAGALFYSIILITTIGYGHIAPKTSWGKVVTIFYAIPGVPLMMLCLANIGDGMAHSFRFLYWKVCCYMCTKRPKRKRRIRSGRSSRRYPSAGPPGPRPRSSSFRRSARASQRSADSHLSDSAFYSYSDPDYRMYDDMGDGLHDIGRTGSNRSRDDVPSSNRSSRVHQKGAGDFLTVQNNSQDDPRVSVLYNKYALEKEGINADDVPIRPPDKMTEKEENQRDKRAEKDLPEITVTQQNKNLRAQSNTPYPDSPPVSRVEKESGYFPRHLQPPAAAGRMPRLEEEYYYDDYYTDYEDDPDEEDQSDKPVPIWLGVMLVVAYIFGGAFLFSGWEGWGFLDSVYFCFITLTTIGFGDFVPAQEKKENAELSIALCSIYLLFGIALLAMSFNLVQEEVISNVKSVAKRLGIIKDEEEEDVEE